MLFAIRNFGDIHLQYQVTRIWKPRVESSWRMTAAGLKDDLTTVPRFMMP